MRIHVLVLPVFAIALKAVGVGEGGLDDDEGGAEADEAEEGHKDVGSGDFHLIDLTVVIIACCPGRGKCGKPNRAL